MADKIFLSVDETAAKLNISRSGVYRLKKNNKLVPRVVGGKKLYHIEDILKFAEGCPFDAESMLKNMGVKITV